MAKPVPTQHGIALRLKRPFKAPPERVFHAWTEPEALKRWWCPPGWAPSDFEVDLQVGGDYRLAMRRLSDDVVVQIHGRFVEVRAPERLVYTWRWEGGFDDLPETRVSVDFVGVEGSTVLYLTHEYFPQLAVRQQHRTGWIQACDRMEQIL